jgi:UDP-GlcNAc:undecaprenyl-phosphate/decaprenyl-phosphate GlcNAc-1-phosphate transferase
MRDYLYILIIAAVVTYLLTPMVRRASIAIGALHAARSRDVHSEPTPLLGGVAMFGGLVAGLLVAERLRYLQQAFPSPRTVIGLLLAGGLLVLIGIVDDRWGLGAISKLAGQIAAGGILVWSGAYLPWIPLPGGTPFLLEPDLSFTLTILIVVITINAVNFIDGLDGLAAGVVGIAALSYLIYSYTLTNSVGIPSQSVPAVASAVLAGICLGFLPHNFHPARIFMGDTGAMLLGLLLAYGPISSAASLDPNILVNYSQLHPVNRFPTVLPLLLPVAILFIPYTDLLLAVIRRTRAGRSPLAADRQHLHHRLLNMGHSHRQSVLLMYLWAALFSGTVVGLSLIRIRLIWLALVTVAAMALLLLATMPRLRPWRSEANGKHVAVRESPVRSGETKNAAIRGAAAANGAVPSGKLSDWQAESGAVPVSGTATAGVPGVPVAPGVPGVPGTPGVPGVTAGPPLPSRPVPGVVPANGTLPANSGTPGMPPSASSAAGPASGAVPDGADSPVAQHPAAPPPWPTRRP